MKTRCLLLLLIICALLVGKSRLKALPGQGGWDLWLQSVITVTGLTATTWSVAADQCKWALPRLAGANGSHRCQHVNCMALRIMVDRGRTSRGSLLHPLSLSTDPCVPPIAFAGTAYCARADPTDVDAPGLLVRDRALRAQNANCYLTTVCKVVRKWPPKVNCGVIAKCN